MSHPFLTTEFHIRWSTLTAEHIEKDIHAALTRAEENLDKFVSQDRGRMNFQSVLIGLDECTRELDEAWTLVEHLDSLTKTEGLREALNAMLPKISSFRAKIPLNEHLWDLIETYSKTDEAKALKGPQARLLEKTLNYFKNHGAELPPEKKQRMEQIESELSAATQKFSENLKDSTDQFELVLDDATRLNGLPQSVIDAAKASAKLKGLGTDEAPKYLFSLKAPSLMPVLQYADDESLRKELWVANTSVGFSSEYDNTDLVWKILSLRQEKAELLGRAQFADLVLDQRMAKTGATALNFVEKLHARSKTAFETEIVQLQEWRAEVEHKPHDLFEPWDFAYWAEKRRKAQYDFDPEELRPYFSVDGVLSGMFKLTEMLFDIKIVERPTVYLANPTESPDLAISTEAKAPAAVEVWHPQVKFYEMRNAAGTHIGSFYADWHPRDGKRPGAWMNCLRAGIPPSEDQERELHLGLICGNMTPPGQNGKPALLTHDEVETVFHEFGHLLHQLLGNVEIRALNGVNVAWDFVELPSQFMENFCWERESLDFFARHYETGEAIPQKLFKRMLAAKNYLSATAMMRQLSFGKMDLELHLRLKDFAHMDLDEVTRQITEGYRTPLKTEAPSMARRFGHLFSDATGYAAGYYSYKWAEVLDADAFTRFQKEGVLNPEVGRQFRDCILSKGNSEDPAKLFRDFMNRDPDPEALLIRSGLV
jgi:oligopeptidase A